MQQLEIGVLDGIRRQFDRNLLSNQHPLPIRADFGEHIGEDLHRLPFDVSGFRLYLRGDVLEQAVRFLEDGDVLQLRASGAALGLQPPVFIQARQQQPNDEGFFIVVADAFQFQHGGAREQVAQSHRARRIQHQPLAAQHQAPHAGLQSGAHIHLDALFVA